MKSGLQLQLSEEISNPIYNNATFIDARNNIEILVSMVQMAYGLPYTHEDFSPKFTVSINLVHAQLELDIPQSPFAKEQERFEMMNEERVEYSNGEVLDLE